MRKVRQGSDTDVRCPCSGTDEDGHMFSSDHRELEEVGMWCLKCDDWCSRTLLKDSNDIVAGFTKTNGVLIKPYEIMVIRTDGIRNVFELKVVGERDGEPIIQIVESGNHE